MNIISDRDSYVFNTNQSPNMLETVEPSDYPQVKAINHLDAEFDQQASTLETTEPIKTKMKSKRPTNGGKSRSRKI